MSLDVDVPREPAGRHLRGWAFDAEFGLPVHLTKTPTEQQAVLPDLEGVLALAAGTTLFHREHIGEVSCHFEFDRHPHRVGAGVADLDLLVPDRAEATPTNDEEP